MYCSCQFRSPQCHSCTSYCSGILGQGPRGHRKDRGINASNLQIRSYCEQACCMVLLRVFVGCVLGQGNAKGVWSPSAKHTFKADLDFPVQAIEISFLKKHLEKMEGKAAQLFSKNKTQTFLSPSCQCPFQLCDLQGATGAGRGAAELAGSICIPRGRPHKWQLQSLARQLRCLPTVRRARGACSHMTNPWLVEGDSKPVHFPDCYKRSSQGFLLGASPYLLAYP